MAGVCAGDDRSNGVRFALEIAKQHATALVRIYLFGMASESNKMGGINF